MRVEPDAREAVDDRRELLERMRTVLDRADLADPSGSLPLPPPDGILRHPAAIEAVHTAQHALRSGPLTAERRAALASVLAGVAGEEPPGFGPAPPQDHLRRSVARALRSIPPRTGAGGAPVVADVAPWDADEQQALVRAMALLAEAWPEMVGELAETVTEVALLDGDAIDGFTDFTVHGAVLIHRSRLTANAAGLPGPVRCAEALVHEGTHTRCNAAAVAEPFLLPAPAPADEGPERSAGAPGALLVATPLRADPRPLSGLFQQTVVLARSVLLYQRLDRLSELLAAEPAAAARRARLTASARQAVDTLGRHADALTEAGRSVLGQCEAVLREPGAQGPGAQEPVPQQPGPQRSGTRSPGPQRPGPREPE
ncbi:aKG-HExxH-type peptide beta-hydroxylase [Streptomyces sp. NPDC088554]|uniref:aKG-HExxH-type peptide beta-hydroxylase n=1 Tax=Streptomyces sp. NPDC088554 TaxID=3365865 RepID=UPI00382E4B89